MSLTFLLAFCFVFVSVVFALDATQSQTLYYNFEGGCTEFSGSSASSILYEPSSNMETLTITPNNWLDDQVLTCNQIVFNSDSTLDTLPKIIGEELMPLVPTTQVNYYNCTYGNPVNNDTMFLMNGVRILTFYFVSDQCDISFSPASYYDFFTLDVQGIAENFNNCDIQVMEGNVEFSNFVGQQSPAPSMTSMVDGRRMEVISAIEGTLTMDVEEFEGQYINTQDSPFDDTCSFFCLGAYYTVICSSEIFFTNNAAFGLFLLDNGNAYVYSNTGTAIGIPCLQEINSGQNILQTFLMGIFMVFAMLNWVL